MKKIDETVLKETKFIAVWVLILSVLMQAVFLIAGDWDLSVLFGNLLGGGFAVLNFFLMGLTVQKAVTLDEKEAKNSVKISQTYRTLMLFVVAVLGITLSCFNDWAAIIPLFFPRIAIAFFVPKEEKNEK